MPEPVTIWAWTGPAQVASSKAVTDKRRRSSFCIGVFLQVVSNSVTVFG
jgi:hypothetical protein